MTTIVTTQTLPKFLIKLSKQLEKSEILEIDIKPTQWLEDTEDYKESERIVEECRKIPGWHQSIIEEMNKNPHKWDQFIIHPRTSVKKKQYA
jgi:hypothetical protein